jgi:hypothetical protein
MKGMAVIMDEESLMREKLDEELYKKLQEETYEDLSVIVQTLDGLKKDDELLMKTLKGKIKDNLYIINAFSADMSGKSLKKLILSPRVVKIYNDAKVSALYTHAIIA